MKYTIYIIATLFLLGCGSDDDSASLPLTSTSSSAVSDLNCCEFNPGEPNFSEMRHTANFTAGQGFVIDSVAFEYLFPNGTTARRSVNVYDVIYESRGSEIIGSAGGGGTTGYISFEWYWRFGSSDSFEMTVYLYSSLGVLSSIHTVERPFDAN